MTERIYEQDSYCRRFSAKVVSCEFENGAYNLVLDRTAFFPEGGGQSADQGVINGAKVLDVQRVGDVVVHRIDSAFAVGDEVACEIDWDLRFSRMQSHTGEHILSGVVHTLFGYGNVGFHMGETVMQVDFDGTLSQEDIERIELLSNKIVYQNASIRAFYPTPEELETIQFRSKIDIREDLRIVQIGEDIDCCACCAPHLARTGEVGLIKILDFSSYKQGTRIEMLAGINAFRDYMNLNAANKQLMKTLSAPRQGIVDVVQELSAMTQTQKGEIAKLSRKLSLYELERNEIADSVYAFSNNLNFDELRYCANHLIESGYRACVLLSKMGESDYLYVVSSKDDDIRGIVKELNTAFAGKGGGQATYSQGKIVATSVDALRSMIEKLLEFEG